ncbi:MAG: hypothetical protein DRN37_04090 [Thermoplasmata archaeon]|nr:MAG: hypothetical protein DRN37_04090 [Thermoplasmata archaeon]
MRYSNESCGKGRASSPEREWKMESTISMGNVGRCARFSIPWTHSHHEKRVISYLSHCENCAINY